jgi:hypothetical protein
LAKNKAFVDTTILADVLLKTGQIHNAAAQALQRYAETILPVFAIKEWKNGPYATYVYVHNLLNRTRRFSATNNAIAMLYRRPRMQSTAFEALAMAAINLPSHPMLTVSDETIADRFRLAFKSMIYLSWESRRSITTTTKLDLDCYLEAGPRQKTSGEIDIQPRHCDGDQECYLAKLLRNETNDLLKIRDAIPVNDRTEDKRRREALRKLAVHPNSRFDRKDCEALGDALFALLAPQDADILTTNLRDHCPLADALGKTAVGP